MGIFDDAIREHLELKRHAGADEEELKELEDEAFGPPARPGDPDFPGTSEEAAVDPEGSAPDAASPEVTWPETAQPGGIFDAQTTVSETTVSETPSDAVIEAPAEELPALTPLDEGAIPARDETQGELAEERAAEPPPAEEPITDEEPVTDEGPVTAEEPVTDEGPVTSDEPEVESGDEAPQPDPSEASSFTTAEREAIADQPTVFFEQQAPAELELGELELDLDEEIEEVGGAVSEPLPDDEPLIADEAFSETGGDTQVAEPPHEVEPEPAADDDEAEGPTDETAAETGEPGTSDEDVLEETPEFLRDNPDDDELWFEQGEPKDFDF